MRFRPGILPGRGRGAAAGLLAWGALAAAAGGAPTLYEGAGGWAIVTDMPESAPPPDKSWTFEDGVWIGRIPEGVSELKWGERILPVAEAQAPPAAVVELPLTRNAFGPCAVRSLSVRFESVVSSHRWSLVFAKDDAVQEIDPLFLPGGRQAGLSMELEDVSSGQRWELHPTRQAREGGKFPGRDDPRFYAGALDEGDIDWSLAVVPRQNGRRILQGRLLLLKSDSRRFRLRIFLQAGAPGLPVLQEEMPPAIVAVAGGGAVGLFPDLAEPRRFRAVSGSPDRAGVEFDLAATKATGNFPRSATFSLEVDAWEAADPEAAKQEAVARLSRAGGAVALPESVAQGGFDAVPVFEPCAMRLSHPGGFRDGADAMQYLLLKTSGLFRDRDWAASAFQCAAKDAQGEPRIVLSGDDAILAVNPDPDLESMLEMGQNRGLALLDRIRRSGAKTVWIRAGSLPGRVDHGARALYLCDYPAVWEESPGGIGVDLGHAEAELISSLSCMLRTEGVCLLVEDGGPMAPFTTYYADALVCGSSNPAEMRRQRALAGPRPVLWTGRNPGAEAEELAENLGFVRP